MTVAELNGQRLGNALAIAEFADTHVLAVPATLDPLPADRYVELLAHLAHGPLGRHSLRGHLMRRKAMRASPCFLSLQCKRTPGTKKSLMQSDA